MALFCLFFGVRVSVTFHRVFILFVVQYGLLSGNLLGKSCALGCPYDFFVF